MNSKNLPELLAPAGSPESLDAAIEAGADAVYFGAGGFNARMRAKNFTESELVSALEKCAQYGVKSYVTVNTRLRDSELSDVLALAERLYLCGASALIVADLGAASLIKRRIPDFELHASTQLSGHSAKDAEALSKLGFSRMVCPREISAQELDMLCKSSPIEIEMFIHGAHCVSFSGQCLMSYALGGRSGNRGLCAQPCRLPFSIEGVKSSHPLSLKDMCLAESVGRIISSGVASLKIEGRQKSADYVYGVVKAYRRFLDERRDASSDETERLSGIFSRDGFTDGYFKSSYRSMLGVRDEDERVPSSGFKGLTRRIPLDASLTVKTGERPRLTYTDGARTATADGETVTARTSGEAMSYDAAREKAARLGNTAFVLRDFDFSVDHDAYFSLSELNRLRREAVKRLCGAESRSDRDFCPVEIGRTARADAPKKRLLTAEFRTVDQIPDEAYGYFDRIYVPLKEVSRADGDKICVYCDPLTYDVSYGDFADALSGYSGEVMVHGLGQASFARSCGARPVGSFRFNVTNSVSAGTILKFVDAVSISPEAPTALCRDISGETSVIIYGRLPLMHTERCMMSDGGASCPFGGAGGRSFPEPKKRASSHAGKTCDGGLCIGEMKDRTGAAFPIVGLSDCSNLIYNSVPVYMADKAEALSKCAAKRFHFIFSAESREECAKVISAYKSGAAPDGAVRRVK